MQTDVLLILRLTFAGLFVGIMFVGIQLLKHSEKLFSADPNAPKRSRTCSRVEAFVIWGHMALLSATFALLLH